MVVSVTEKTKPENKKEVERKIEIKESKEAKSEEEEEEDKVSGSKKKDTQKKLSKYSFSNSSSNICNSRTSRDQVYLDGEKLEMPSSSSSLSASSSSSSSGDSKELSPLSGSRGSSPAVQTNGALCASNVSCAAANILTGRRQEQPPTNLRGPMRGSGTFRLQTDKRLGGKPRDILEPGPGKQPHST